MSSQRSRGFGAVVVTMLFGLGLVGGGGCSSSASAGGEAQACYPNDTCNAGLTCKSHKCVTGGAAGTGGVAGSMATAGSGGVAGAGGGNADGSAGADGAAAADGAADADGAGHADDAADADGPSCGVSPGYGPVTFAAAVQSAVGRGDMANGASPSEVDWNAPLNNDVKPDILDLALVNGQAPFAAGLTAMDAIDLAGQDDFKTCGACVLIIAHADTNFPPLKAGDDYIATSGTLKLTTVPTLPLDVTSRVMGTLTNVVFKHVRINATSFVTTKLDDCTITISSATFNAAVVASP
jgi:hypothetical protein